MDYIANKTLIQLAPVDKRSCVQIPTPNYYNTFQKK